MSATLKDLEVGDAQAIEEFEQFLKWAGPPDAPRPTLFLAAQWYEGLLTIEEGRQIEENQQRVQFLQYIAQFLKSA